MITAARWLLGGLLSISGTPLWAQQSGSWSPVVSVEFLAVGNAARHAQSVTNELEATCRTLLQAGVGSCTAGVTSYGAAGARAGLPYYASDDISIGPSLWYLYGGPTAGKVSIDLRGPDGSASGRTTNHTIRLLAEGKKKFHITEKWNFYIGAGMGWALVSEDFSCSESGILAGICASAPSGSNTGWFTWGVTPSIFFKSVEIGLRYVGFGRGKELPWNTGGAFVGYEF